MSAITNARNAWRLLNGAFCIYKPAEISHEYVNQIITKRLVRYLNEIPEGEKPMRVVIEGMFLY